MIVVMIAGEMIAKGPTGEAAKSGPWGLAIILILCAACYFLFKSMSKHMRRVREEFPTQEKKPQSPVHPADSTSVEGEEARPDAGNEVRPDGGSDDGAGAGDEPTQP